jgi:glyceraldehyde 3-phosphate dehydrogenase
MAMAIRVAINGYGRIGGNILRALYEAHRTDEIELVAVNSLGAIEVSAHLTKYDTIHGPFPGKVEIEGKDLLINGHHVQFFSDRDPLKLPWGKLGVDLVMECTGAFNSRDKAAIHLEAGAKKVLISAPAKDADATIVYGVNHDTLKSTDTIVSNASCTTNCLAPMVKPLNDEIGLVNGLMNTIHAFTNDQMLNDNYHTDLRRARSSTRSIIPTKTGAAAAVGLVLPELAGRLDGFAMRVPTNNVSVVDLTFQAARDTSVEEVNAILKTASEGAFKGILDYCELPLVSCDFNHVPASSIIDPDLTRVNGRLVKVCAWYDNEWGFSNRMLDTACKMMSF